MHKKKADTRPISVASVDEKNADKIVNLKIFHILKDSKRTPFPSFKLYLEENNGTKDAINGRKKKKAHKQRKREPKHKSAYKRIVFILKGYSSLSSFSISLLHLVHLSLLSLCPRYLLSIFYLDAEQFQKRMQEKQIQLLET